MNFFFIIKFSIDDGSRISVFPGKATTLSAETDDKKISDKVKRLATQADDLKYKSLPGNSIKLRITDPFVSTVKPILRGHLLNKEKVTLLDRLPLKRGSVRMKFSGKEKGDLLILMTA